VPADGRRLTRSPVPRDSARVARQPVEFLDSGDLIRRCVRALNDRLEVGGLRYVVQTGEQRTGDGAGFTATGSSAPAGRGPAAASLVAYDLIGEIAARTRLTRRTVASILRQVSADTFGQYRQGPDRFIAESARLINEQRDAASGLTQ
jgi:type III restriction enzyme